MAEEHAAAQPAAENTNSGNTFDIRKIYIKDASLESPHAPDIFLNDPGQPEVGVECSIKSRSLSQEGFYEVLLSMTITSKIADKTAFLPQLLLAPINFEALFQQKLAHQEAQAKQSSEQSSPT